MTTLDPKHLDALVGWLKSPWANASPESERGPIPEWIYSLIYEAAEAITALRAENDRLSNLWQIEHDHATALRAEIDRERAATIEAAVAMAEAEGFLSVQQIRALHTDATRAAMDAIRREGYEAGVREAAACVEIVGQANEDTPLRLPACAEWITLQGIADNIRELATGTPPDPDTTPRK